ncbi:PREDICTED: cell wall protein DAN4-like [Rhagoletis zephyria]|uniref:cell wall protein DAN4-like n=1 Tax=Rhagoletis zephyria TaxID=28612 RepID=UPI0008119AED|nr:PREDICTED: cell wall protein DAN4-like [Rhagoletis zephyria]
MIAGEALLALSSRERALIAALTGRCSECFSNGVACLDEQTFAVCIDNIPTAVSTPCPAATVCTAEQAICLATAQGALPVCYEDQCGTCTSVQRNFTCLDVDTYALCFDGQTPAPSSIDSCPQGYVCDLTSSDVCSPSQTTIPSCISGTNSTTTTTTDATTETTTDTTTLTTTTTSTIDTTTGTTTISTAETTTDTTTQTTSGSATNLTTETTTDSTTTTSSTTTPSITASTTTSTTDSTTDTTTPTTTTTTLSTTTRAPNTFCAEIGQTGNFRPDGDTTCAVYINCYLLSGQYLGWKYTCRYYFNAATGLCQTERPADC